jgi:hypothetical protein
MAGVWAFMEKGLPSFDHSAPTYHRSLDVAAQFPPHSPTLPLLRLFGFLLPNKADPSDLLQRVSRVSGQSAFDKPGNPCAVDFEYQSRLEGYAGHSGQSDLMTDKN